MGRAPAVWASKPWNHWRPRLSWQVRGWWRKSVAAAAAQWTVAVADNCRCDSDGGVAAVVPAPPRLSRPPATVGRRLLTAPVPRATVRRSSAVLPSRAPR